MKLGKIKFPWNKTTKVDSLITVKPKKISFLNEIKQPIEQTTNNKVNRIFPRQIKFLERGTNKDYIFKGTFHEAMSPVLVMAQCFAVMPVIGIKSDNSSGLHFEWRSYRTIYSIISATVLFFYTCLTIYRGFSVGIEFSKIVSIVFYASNTYSVICFLFLARKWPELMRQWEMVEHQLPEFKRKSERGVLAHRIKMTTMIVMSLSLAEHILSIISLIHNAKNCHKISKDPFEAFFIEHLLPFFYVTSYSPTKAFFGKLINILGTFNWSFMDLFVMLISIGLSSRFKQINENMIKFKGQPMPVEFYAEHRQYYRNLCDLCETVDDAIGKITLISFSNNLYFICVQLLNSLKTMTSLAHTIYFWFSMVYLIGRTLAVSLYSAQINDESKKPVDFLRSVPRETWCLEVKRFSEEITNDVVALSGMKFFYLTRKLVLSVAGTIVTYELVLIQFQKDDETVETIC